MNATHPPIDPLDAEIAAVDAALRRAAARAKQLAIDTNTGVTIWKDDGVRCISADELRVETDSKRQPSTPA